MLQVKQEKEIIFKTDRNLMWQGRIYNDSPKIENTR
jgi:hypothetical protein